MFKGKRDKISESKNKKNSEAKFILKNTSETEKMSEN